MLECYMLSVCRNSSVDKDSNKMSLFLMVEELHFRAEKRPEALPVEVHTYWLSSDDEKNNEVEFRVVREAPDGSLEPGPSVMMLIKSAITRNRFFALRTPTQFGTYKLRVEWRRRKEDEWIREKAYWPLIIHEIIPEQPPTAALTAQSTTQ